MPLPPRLLGTTKYSTLILTSLYLCKYFHILQFYFIPAYRPAKVSFATAFDAPNLIDSEMSTTADRLSLQLLLSIYIPCDKFITNLDLIIELGSEVQF